MSLRVIPLGGLGEIGLNSMLFDDGESALLLDAGLMFPDDTMPGVDFVIPDFGPLGEVAPRLEGLLLSHGHEDHTGAVAFLLKEMDLPVYGTRLTLGLLRNRLAEHGLADTARLRTIGRNERFRLGRFDIEAFPTCHSIPDGVGYILRCSEGVFVHTGDFKLDPRPPDGVGTDLDRLARLAREEGVTALFSDSTNVEREGISPPEATVGETLSEMFRTAPGRVIVAMFSSNLHRIREALNAAARHGRKVALCGRSMIGNVATAIDLECVRLPSPDLLIPVDEAESRPGREVAVLTTGSQGEPRSALALMALGEHKTIRIRPGDTVILSSKFIPGNERAIANVINHLFLAGADVRYEKISEIHVSGHASREELRAMVRAVRPEYFIPVHGEPRHLVMHCALARGEGVGSAEFAQNGDVLEFSGGRLSRNGKVPVGRLFVDGKDVGEVEGILLRDRHHLARSGVVMVVMAVSRAGGELLYGPEVVARGVVSENGADSIMEDAREVVLEVWNGAGSEAKTDMAELTTGIRKGLRRFFNRRLDRKPMILPVLLEL
ncbi:MAG: ribonuclease J [Deltaproteobacteria bacterium]